MKKLLLITLVLVLALSLSACGGGNTAPQTTTSPPPTPAQGSAAAAASPPAQGAHPLVGTWVWDSDDTFEYIFHADGRGTRGFGADIITFNWSTQGNELTLTGRAQEEVWTYTISGNTLTITNIQAADAAFVGMTFSYIRVGDVLPDIYWTPSSLVNNILPYHNLEETIEILTHRSAQQLAAIRDMDSVDGALVIHLSADDLIALFGQPDSVQTFGRFHHWEYDQFALTFRMMHLDVSYDFMIVAGYSIGTNLFPFFAAEVMQNIDLAIIALTSAALVHDAQIEKWYMGRLPEMFRRNSVLLGNRDFAVFLVADDSGLVQLMSVYSVVEFNIMMATT